MKDTQIIEEIIHSLKTFAIGDIEFNIERPISAFILCSCLIDQLAAFRYNHGFSDNKEYYNEFIKEYLPQYRGLNLYINLRCKLVHNYTVGKHIRITNEDVIFENIGKGKNVNVINAKLLFKDLKIVFDRFCNEFRDVNSISRINALACYRERKIITQGVYHFTTFLENETNLLIAHYKKLLLGKFMNNDKNLKINSISKREIYKEAFLIEVKATYGNEDFTCHLDEIIRQFNLDSLKEVLKNLH